MNCARCGKPVPPGSAFCMHCGTPVAHVTGGHPPAHVSQGFQPPPYAAPVPDLAKAQAERTNRTAVILGILFCLLGVGAVLGFKAIGGLKVSAAMPPDQSLALKSHLQPAALAMPATRTVMPDDIKNWLEHLHQTEIKRVAITNSQIGQEMVEKEKLTVGGGVDAVKDALNGIDDPNAQLHPPTEGLARMLKQMHDQTTDLQKDFDSYPAPEECQPIQAAYDQALSETAAELGDIGDHLAAGDLDKLMSMKGVSTGEIDAAGATSDRLVGEICDKYDTRRWFSVNKDISGGGLFSIPGF